MLLWVLGQRGARVSHPGAQGIAFPAGPVLDSSSGFVLAPWPWAAWRQVLQGEGFGAGSKAVVTHTTMLSLTLGGKKR